MTISTSRLAYLDCFKVLEAALTDLKGARIRMPTHDAAIYFRMRIHMARKIDRRDNLSIYEPGDFMHGRSQYDRLVLRIKEEDSVVWLYLEKAQVDMGLVEALADEPDPDIGIEGPKPQLRLGAPKPEPRPEALTITAPFRRI